MARTRRLAAALLAAIALVLAPGCGEAEDVERGADQVEREAREAGRDAGKAAEGAARDAKEDAKRETDGN